MNLNEVKYIKKDSFSEIAEFRNDYLDCTYDSQELYLELFCQKSKIYQLELNQKVVGYFVLGNDSTIFEFYILENWIQQNDAIFKKVVQDFQIKKALSKSFDFNMMACCLGIQKRTKVIGVLFREKKNSAIAIDDSDIKIRLAETADISLIKEVNEDVFETEEEINWAIENQGLFIFEKNAEFLGLGLCNRTVEGRPDFDIGMLVDRKFRGRGYGKYIINYLYEYCRQNGWRGTCGCAIENIASRKCLESAGFIGRHRMIEFEF